MAAERAAACALRHYEKAQKENSKNVIFLPDESNLLVCHILITGLPYPYHGGEFIFRLTCPPEFPQKPPSLECLTDNGVYEPGPKICISIGEYHASDRKGHDGGDAGWRPAMGIRGFAHEVMNGLIVPDQLNLRKHSDSGKGGIGILDTTPAERVKLATNSKAYNLRHCPEIRKQFWEFATSQPGQAAQAWMQYAAKLALVSQPQPIADGKLYEACGELYTWGQTIFPPVKPELGGGTVLSMCAHELAMCDENLHKAHLAARAVVMCADPASGWSVLFQELPNLEKKQEALRSLSQASLERVLLGYLYLTMQGKFDERDRLQ